jgi:hypothetical protein
VEAYRVVRCLGIHIFWTIVSQMTARLSALRTGLALPHRKMFWYSFLLEAQSTPRSYRTKDFELENLSRYKGPATVLLTEARFLTGGLISAFVTICRPTTWFTHPAHMDRVTGAKRSEPERNLSLTSTYYRGQD